MYIVYCIDVHTHTHTILNEFLSFFELWVYDFGQTWAECWTLTKTLFEVTGLKSLGSLELLGSLVVVMTEF